MTFDDYMTPIWQAKFNPDERKKPELLKKAQEKLKFFLENLKKHILI